MKAVIIDDRDNVAVVVQDTPKDAVVSTAKGDFSALEEIKTGHKIAIKDIQKGEHIIKYGTNIGDAACDIKIGEWVHCHNVIDTTEKICDEYEAYYRAKVKEAKGQ